MLSMLKKVDFSDLIELNMKYLTIISSLEKISFAIVALSPSTSGNIGGRGVRDLVHDFMFQVALCEIFLQFGDILRKRRVPQGVIILLHYYIP